ncbi:MAG TPA: SDR family oxidoreductase [Myxococcales bacterium]|nr:SDR family oxidoreductase [Myxococcales bacterium]
MRVVVTGANRGIGLELTRQLLARSDEVEALTRDPDRARELHALLPSHGASLKVLACDVASDSSVRTYARTRPRVPVDLLINNAGVYGTSVGLEKQDPAELLQVFDVNAAGAFRMTRALFTPLRQGQGRKIAHITSSMGSISENTSGGYYAYRMSKAALNMFSVTLAEEVRKHGLISVVLNPGWAQTDMGGPGAPVPVRDSAAGLLRIIDRLTLADSGKFFDYRDGDEIPW